MKTSPTHRAGFTLLELLVVVAILGILAALLVGVMGNMRKQANVSATLQHTRSVLQAMMQYASDNNNQLPPARNTAPAVPGYGANWWWNLIISQYLTPNGQPETSGMMWATSLRCPGAPKFVSGSAMSGPPITFAVNFTGWNSAQLRVFAQNNQPGGGLSGGSARLSQVSPKTMLVGLGTTTINNPHFTPVPSGNEPVEVAGGLNFSWLDGKSVVGKADGSAAVISWKDWQGNAGDIWGPKPQ